MYSKYETLEALNEAYDKCVVCNKQLNYDLGQPKTWRKMPKCNDNHYILIYRTYRYSGKRYYRPVNELILIDNVLVCIGHRWRITKSLKVSLSVLKDEAMKTNFGEHFSYLGEKISHYHKVFTYNRFKKLYKFDDRALFLAKIEKLKKALILT